MRINPTTTTPSVNKAVFQSDAADLPEKEAVNTAISVLKQQTERVKMEFAAMNTDGKKPRKETAKGTQVISTMIQKDVFRALRMYAAQNDVTMSDVINRAFVKYLGE